MSRVQLLDLRYSNGKQATPRGRQPEGETTLSSAERQARYRAPQNRSRGPCRTADALRGIEELDLTELQVVIPPLGAGRD